MLEAAAAAAASQAKADQNAKDAKNSNAKADQKAPAQQDTKQLPPTNPYYDDNVKTPADNKAVAPKDSEPEKLDTRSVEEQLNAGQGDRQIAQQAAQETKVATKDQMPATNPYKDPNTKDAMLEAAAAAAAAETAQAKNSKNAKDDKQLL